MEAFLGGFCIPMIDFHCHILPAIDDGSQSMEQSLELARQSVAGGISHVVATPHGGCRDLAEQLARRDQALKSLRARLAQESIPLELISGMEYRADSEFWNAVLRAPECRCGLDKGEARPLLLEMPLDMDITIAADIYFKAQLKGVNIVLAHPERYRGFVQKADMLLDLQDKGLCLQFNAAPLRRGFPFFDSLQKTILKLIAHAPDQVVLGSDAHNPEHRPGGFAMAKDYVTSRLGEKTWHTISEETPRRLLGL